MEIFGTQDMILVHVWKRELEPYYDKTDQKNIHLVKLSQHY
jgi:hypothetical protein